jgi:hypothetical protein
MTATALQRERLHGFLDAIPDYGLSVVEPILAHLADDPLVIETDLTAEEKSVIQEGRKLRREHPEEFVTLDYLIAHEDEFHDA